MFLIQPGPSEVCILSFDSIFQPKIYKDDLLEIEAQNALEIVAFYR